MKVRTPYSRSPKWRLYADNLLAPLRRKYRGSITPEIRWRHYADNEMAPIRRKFTGMDGKAFLDVDTGIFPRIEPSLTIAISVPALGWATSLSVLP
jgi:hypothetical protein